MQNHEIASFWIRAVSPQWKHLVHSWNPWQKGDANGHHRAIYSRCQRINLTISEKYSISKKNERTKRHQMEWASIKKAEFEHQLERQKIFLKYLHYISTPLFIISLFYSIMLAASLLLIMYALRCFSIFRLERFEHLLYTKQMVIFVMENQKSNPDLRQQQLEMDPDQYLQSQMKMRRQF